MGEGVGEGGGVNVWEGSGSTRFPGSCIDWIGLDFIFLRVSYTIHGAQPSGLTRHYRGDRNNKRKASSEYIGEGPEYRGHRGARLKNTHAPQSRMGTGRDPRGHAYAQYPEGHASMVPNPSCPSLQTATKQVINNCSEVLHSDRPRIEANETE